MKTLVLFLVLIISDFVFSQEKESCELYIPNAISMNCDTGEDWQFRCVSNCNPISFEIEIYSRRENRNSNPKTLKRFGMLQKNLKEFMLTN